MIKITDQNTRSTNPLHRPPEPFRLIQTVKNASFSVLIAYSSDPETTHQSKGAKFNINPYPIGYDTKIRPVLKTTQTLT